MVRDRPQCANGPTHTGRLSPPATVGIVYGAAHMKVATAVLMGMYRYQVERSEWLTVFDYESP
jgi:hypothetical protein